MAETLTIPVDLSGVQTLTTSLADLASEMRGLAGPSSALSRDLDKQTGEMRDTARATDTATGKLTSMQTATASLRRGMAGLKGPLTDVGKAMGGFSTRVAQVALAAVTAAAAKFIKDGISGIIEETPGLQEALDDLKKDYDEMTKSVVGAFVSGEDLRDLVHDLRTAFQFLSTRMKESTVDLQNNDTATSNLDGVVVSLAGVLGRVVEVVAGARVVWNGLRLGLIAVGAVVANVANAWVQLTRFIVTEFLGAMSRALGAIEAGARAMGRTGLADSIATAKSSFEGFASTIDEYAGYFDQFASDSLGALSGAYDDLQTSIADVNDVVTANEEFQRRLAERIEEARKELAEYTEGSEGHRLATQRLVEVEGEAEDALKRVARTLGMSEEAYNKYRDAMAKAVLEAGRLKEARLEEEKSLAELARLQQENARIKTSRAEAEAREAELAHQQALADAEVARLDRLNRLGIGQAQLAASSAQLASGMGRAFSAAATGQESLAESSKKLVGELITSLGQSAIAGGAIALIGDPTTGFFPNPAKGAGLIAAGTAAVTLGSMLGASGGRGGGGRRGGGQKAPQGPTVALPSNVYSTRNGGQSQGNQGGGTVVNINGVVGDARGLARQLQDIDRAGRRAGVSTVSPGM